MKWLAPKTVAAILDVHRSTASRLMKSGALPGFEMFPGQWRVSEEALIKFIRRRERSHKVSEAEEIKDV